MTLNFEHWRVCSKGLVELSHVGVKTVARKSPFPCWPSSTRLYSSRQKTTPGEPLQNSCFNGSEEHALDGSLFAASSIKIG